MSLNPTDKLIETIRARLEHDQRINLNLSKPRITPQGDRLILEGQVEDITTKRLIANLTRELAGDDFEVEDRLRIFGHEIGDGALRAKVAAMLMDEPVFRNFSIEMANSQGIEVLRDKRDVGGDRIMVEVESGVVTLSGQVNSLTHRRLAEALLWWIDGCQRIDNYLEVSPPEQDNDDELADAVRMILEKDPMIDAGQVRIAIKAGIVELGGQLSNETLRDLAARDVWAVPDVWEVYNRIHVGRLGA